MPEEIYIKPEPGTEKAIFEHDAPRFKTRGVGFSLIKKLNERIGPEYPPKKGYRTVLVIPHDSDAEACLDVKKLQAFLLRPKSSLSKVLSMYQKSYRSCSAVCLYRANGSKPLQPKAKIDALLNGARFVLLRAADVGLEEEKMWEVFAIRSVVDHTTTGNMTEVDLPRLHRQMNREWNDLSYHARKLLDFQAGQFSSLKSDTIQQRAFWLVYQEYLQKSRSSNPRKSVRREEGLFFSVLDLWQGQSPQQSRDAILKAAEHSSRFPLSACPQFGHGNHSQQGSDDADIGVEVSAAEMHTFDHLSLETLEIVVAEIAELIEQLDGTLKSSSVNLTAWMGSFATLDVNSQPPTTNIGILGATGLGKSTLVNALLDEKDLLPTSFVEACTAAPIEIKFNESLGSRYHVRVRFVPKFDWEQDILLCLQYLRDQDSGIDDTAKETIAKVRAAYPEFKDNEMDEVNLKSVNAVMEKLGGVEDYTANTAEELLQLLRRYVASKEIPTFKGNTEGTRYFWPIVESIELHLHSPVLRSGVTLIDLPGVQDSNRARNAVARNYLASCSHVFFVSDINRAASDQAVMNFVSEQGRALHTSRGETCNLTIVCSKADQLSHSLSQAEQVGVGSEYQDLIDEHTRSQCAIQATNDKITEQKLRHTISTDQWASIDVALIDLDRDLEDVKAGKTVYERSSSEVLASAEHVSRASKRRRVRLQLEAQDSGNSGTFTANEIRYPLTEEEISAKITRLETEQKDIEGQLGELKKSLPILEEEREKLQAVQLGIPVRQFRTCHAARNEYTQNCLRNKIAHELQQIQSESAQQGREQNPSGYGPETGCLSDYTVPMPEVFCVAAKSYLNPGDKAFNDPKDTQIPQLREHCLDLNEDSKIKFYRSRLNTFEAAISGLQIWADVNTSDQILTIEQQASKVQDLENALKTHVQSINSEADGLIQNLYGVFELELWPKAKAGIAKCKIDAPATIGSWKAMSHAAYKATVRKRGVNSSKNTAPINFNEDLCKPFVNTLTQNWNKMLSGSINTMLDSTLSQLQLGLTKLHDSAFERATALIPGSTTLVILKSQRKKYNIMLGDALDDLSSALNTMSWAFNHDAQDVIRDRLHTTYTALSELGGRGYGLEMQRRLKLAIEGMLGPMFKQVETGMRKNIETAFEEASEAFKSRVVEIANEAAKDYLNAVSKQTEKISAEEQEIRSEVSKLLKDFRARYDTTTTSDNSGVEDAETRDDDDEGHASEIKVETEAWNEFTTSHEVDGTTLYLEGSVMKDVVEVASRDEAQVGDQILSD